MDSLNIVVSGNIISVIKWDIYNILLYHPSCCLDVEIKMYICSKGLKRNKRHLLLSHNSEFMVDMLSLCTSSDYVQGICQWSRLSPFDMSYFYHWWNNTGFLVVFCSPCSCIWRIRQCMLGMESSPSKPHQNMWTDFLTLRIWKDVHLQVKLCHLGKYVIKQNNKMSQECFKEFTWLNFKLLQSCFPVDPLLPDLPSVLV